MVQGRNISWLKFNCVFIILFRFFEFAKFVPAKGSIVKSFEVLWVDFDRILVIINCTVKLLFLTVGEASVVIEVGFGGFYLNGQRELFDGFIVVSFTVQADAFVIIGICIIWIN